MAGWGAPVIISLPHAASTREFLASHQIAYMPPNVRTTSEPVSSRPYEHQVSTVIRNTGPGFHVLFLWQTNRLDPHRQAPRDSISDQPSICINFLETRPWVLARSLCQDPRAALVQVAASTPTPSP
ncbi:hypothetical protein BDR05DRAFT_962420 [Suillus weaverae]|nr:hypothetical protein BDR05DRAFT_962420 [Suillus weaverae]